jgi:hypothetical protein
MLFFKPNRPVNKVFIHCSASDNPSHDDVDVIRGWHRKRGWSDIGYHYFITKRGIIQKGRDLERTPAAQKGHNTGSIAICLHGLEIDKFTTMQFECLKRLCGQINQAYNSEVTFHAHNEVNPHKTCPVFDIKEVLNLDDQGYIC